MITWVFLAVLVIAVIAVTWLWLLEDEIRYDDEDG